MVVPRILPYINFVIASTSLGVQIFILEPWHVTLDDRFEKLKNENRKILDETLSSHDRQFNAIESRLESLLLRTEAATEQIESHAAVKA